MAIMTSSPPENPSPTQQVFMAIRITGCAQAKKIISPDKSKGTQKNKLKKRLGIRTYQKKKKRDKIAEKIRTGNDRRKKDKSMQDTSSGPTDQKKKSPTKTDEA